MRFHSFLISSIPSSLACLDCLWHDGLQCLGMRPALGCLFLALFCDSKCGAFGLRMSQANDGLSCTSMSTLQGNMPAWVGLVPYSHLVNKSWGYPTDCSGFVSWALQVILNAHVTVNDFPRQIPHVAIGVIVRRNQPPQVKT